MKFIADFHIHSHYSVATSKLLIPEYLDYWARIKGITVVGTGDFTHPGWLGELQEKLEPAEQGLFKLKDAYKQDPDLQASFLPDAAIRFILTAEISTIYKKKGKVRKIHQVLLAPDFQAAQRIQQALAGIGGNITSDGRPILGLDSKDLLDMCLNASGTIEFIPAHIWTPWFSVLGAQSGFDDVQECFEDLTSHIHAVETGLSSDPAMNRLCGFLDKYTLISNSDAHSPGNLGREANIFDTELSYDSIVKALREGNGKTFTGTVEFFPQEGKYHYDGHRKCAVLWDPAETIRSKGICPVCGKQVTVGVMNRVAQLADRTDAQGRENRIPFHSVIPLKEMLSEITGAHTGSKRNDAAYQEVIRKFGAEFNILLSIPPQELSSAGHEMLAEGIRRMREGRVIIREGFDGEYGIIKVFADNEKNLFSSQESLFPVAAEKKSSLRRTRKSMQSDAEEYIKLHKEHSTPEMTQEGKNAPYAAASQGQQQPGRDFNSQQRAAIRHFTGPALILAGPGTGKTSVLTARIAELIAKRNVDPATILAVTFTNKAAREMKNRLLHLISDKTVVEKILVSTFHALGFSILKQQCGKTGRHRPFCILDEEEKTAVLTHLPECAGDKPSLASNAITLAKQQMQTAETISDSLQARQFAAYEASLKNMNAFDLDDLIYEVVLLFTAHPGILSDYQNRFQWILIDEYQDINHAQYRMMSMLLGASQRNLFAIGDPHQAIYGFRGADVGFIRRFLDDFPDATVYKLKQSYRCSEYILKASHQVISAGNDANGNLHGTGKGIKIVITPEKSDRSEAECIARTIEQMMGGLRFFSIDSRISEGDRSPDITSLSDFAVLCRVARQMDAIEKAFHDHSIPYQIAGDVPFFRQEPVQSIVAILKSSITHSSIPARDRLLKKYSIDSIVLNDLLHTIVSKETVAEKIATIASLYLRDQNLQENPTVKELLAAAKPFADNSEDFIAYADLSMGIDAFKPNTEAVSIMTIHAAKGLEFPCVFIPGCEQGLIPYSLFENQKVDEDEERRLLYVAMTRARRYLYLSHAEKRFLFGREYRLNRSPFIDNIEKELLKVSKSTYKKKEKQEDIQLSLF